MKPQAVLQLVIIVSGILIGAHFSKLSYGLHDTEKHHTMKTHDQMDHGTIDVSGDSIIPGIDSLIVSKDPNRGWNLNIELTNFRFAPENVNKLHQPGEGHAHLYVNGVKMARLYHNWFHLSNIPEGKNQIEVILTSNAHQIYVYNHKPISKKIILKN